MSTCCPIPLLVLLVCGVGQLLTAQTTGMTETDRKWWTTMRSELDCEQWTVVRDAIDRQREELRNSGDTLSLRYPMTYTVAGLWAADQKRPGDYEALQRASQLYKELPPPRPEIYWFNQMVRAQLLQRDRKYHDASALLENLELDNPQLSPYLKAEVQYQLGKCYRKTGQYEASQRVLDDALKILADQDSIPNAMLANVHSMAGIVTNKLGNLDRALHHADRALYYTRADLPEGTYNLSLGDRNYNFGNLYLQLGALTQAEASYQNAIDIYNHIGTLEGGYYNSISGLAIVHRVRGDYDKALELYLRSLEAKLRKTDPYPPNLATSYYNIGVLYDYRNEPEKAIPYLEEALRIHKDYFKTENNVSYQNFRKSLALVKSHLDQPEEAYKIIQSVLASMDRMGKMDHYHVVRMYSALGAIAKRMGNTEEAIEAYENAIELVERVNPRQADVTSNREKSARLHAEAGRFGAARRELNAALNFFGWKTDRGVDPDTIRYLYNLLAVLNTKADVARMEFSATDDVAHLLQADRCYQECFSIMDYVRRGHRNDGSKELLYEQNFKTFSGALATLRLLYDQRRDPELMQRAADIAERSRGMLLHEALSRNEIMAYRNVPTELVQRQQDLRAELNLLERLRHKTFKSELERASLPAQEMNNRIYQLKTEFYALQDTFRTLYPEFDDLQSGAHAIELADLQRQLTDDRTAVVSYFLGEADLHTFTITNQGTDWLHSAADSSFTSQIEAAHRALSQPNGSTDLNTLSSTLLASVLNTLPATVDRLIIIPHAQLGYVPFGVLPIPDDPFTRLIDSYDISYAYSAGLLVRQRQMDRPAVSGGLLAFAPSYGTDSQPIALRSGAAELMALPGAQREAQRIAALMDGKAIREHDATETRFRQLASDYQVLHLSCHAEVDDDNPSFSRLLFQADSIHDGQLTVAELYNLPLRAHLAVLSACNTGTGKLRRSEGMLSLSRAFTYAGVPSTVMSLWKVPDATTARIMELFYGYLKAGKRKSEALRMAKLDYLNETVVSEYRHPFYWAGFVLVGDADPLPTTNWFIKYGGMALALGGLGLIIYFAVQSFSPASTFKFR